MADVTENELWLLSFYRNSEIGGALFFGRLARILKAGAIQHDMTKHFSDESRHAWYWTQCIEELGAHPLQLEQTYQDQYFSAAGTPSNVMEILAITHVFEKRVVRQYTQHLLMPNLRPEIHRTLKAIMEDEKWHIQWVGDALESLKPKYGAMDVDSTLERYRLADLEAYGAILSEHAARLGEFSRKDHGDVNVVHE